MEWKELECLNHDVEVADWMVDNEIQHIIGEVDKNVWVIKKNGRTYEDLYALGGRTRWHSLEVLIAFEIAGIDKGRCAVVLEVEACAYIIKDDAMYLDVEQLLITL